MSGTAPGSDSLSPAAGDWVERSLAAVGARLVGPPVHRHTRPWSTVWSAPTDHGVVWLKQSSSSQVSEGGVHSAVATLAPGYVDAPIAVDPTNGWMLTRDGGTTVMAAAPETRGIETDTLVGLLTDYARMQRLTLGRRDSLVEAGIRELDPRDADQWAGSQADYLARLPPDDPRHLNEEQHQRVIAALPDLAVAGKALAEGAVPGAIDQGDLWPRNVFLPRPGGHYRIFDFADAAWAHPFTSLVMLATECLHRWRIGRPDSFIDLRDDRIRTVFDAYLAQWTDFAPLSALRELAQHALRIAPLHRSSVWVRILHTADTATVARHGTTPWAWLRDVTRPVLL